MTIQSAPGRILIVDDDQDMLYVLRDCLTDHNFVPYFVTNARDALGVMRRYSPDILLLDVNMPEVGGLALLRQVREQHSAADLPILMMSVEADMQIIVRALEAGANDYLTKPIELDVLIARVRTHLELKRLQDFQSEQIAQLERLDAMKEQFLQIAAHDLKNPLGVLRMAVDLLATIDPAGSDWQEERGIAIQSAHTALRTMDSIIRDFLDLRALKEGQFALNVQQVSATHLVAEAMTQFQMAAAEKGISLHSQIEPDLPEIGADPDRVAQVLHNLISNAIKFSSEGAEVHVRLCRAQGGIRFEVEDNGPGIKPGEMHLLFQEFSRLSNRPTGRERSSGVGLSIAKRLIDLHRGQIGANSEVGHGSLFWFELPV